MYSGEFKSNRFWCVSVALYHGIQNHVFCPHLEMVPNMLFWHETSSKVEKSWKMDFWKFFKIFPLSPRHFGVFLVKKSKIWNFAGNGPKHFVLTWNEFWSWKIEQFLICFSVFLFLWITVYSVMYLSQSFRITVFQKIGQLQTKNFKNFS